MTVLYRSDELRRLEERAGKGLPSGTLMQRAGASAAEWVHAWLGAHLAPIRPRAAQGQLLVLCGPGNNGGDGYACASALRRLGHHCLCWAPRAGNRTDALAARARWQQDGGRVTTGLPESSHVAVVIDALFGIGVQRPLDGPYLDALRWVQAHGLPLLALDVPSGLDADTGAWVGGVAGAPALQTITFLGDKPGLHTLEGIDAAGAVTVAPLGIEDPGSEAFGRLNEPGLFPRLLQARPANCNKGDFGTLAIVGGAPGMVGAALLAGRAALRLGAGKVYVHCLGAPTLAVDPMQPELMLRPWVPAAADAAAGPTVDVLVAGCGLGTDAAARTCVEQALAHAGVIVLDADALNLLATHQDLRERLLGRDPASTVLTPHPGEAARLLATDTRTVQQDRVGQAQALARDFNAVVVLKGAGSVIAIPPAQSGPYGRYVINPTGSGALASAGTGDVLSGMIGALLAQSTHAGPAALPSGPVIEAVLGAVWLHGQAANDFGAAVGLSASDIAPLAARALSNLCSQASARPAG